MSHSAAFTWQTVRNFIWLLFAAACLLLALILWASQLKHKEVEVIEFEKQAQEAARPVQSQTVGMDTNLATFTNEVRPIVLKQRVTSSGDHAPEFRGSKFLSESQKSWTLQVMKVQEEDIIRSYLDKREDRKKFQYFRLQEEGQPEQFVLTYGIYKDVKEVLNKTNQLDLQLPDAIKTLPEKFSTYAPLVNDLGTDEISSGLKLRPVNLTRAALPVIPSRALNVPSTSSTSDVVKGGTTTTIKQTDQKSQQQNVRTETSHVPSSLQEQRTSPTPRPQSSDSQVIDPF